MTNYLRMYHKNLEKKIKRKKRKEAKTSQIKKLRTFNIEVFLV